MRRRYRECHVIAGLAVMLLSLLSTGANAAGEIQRNPFVRPPIEVLQEQNPAETDRQIQAWRPVLRAVLVAGGKSVADLGGVILKIGESTNGYRLLTVREGTATFSRDGERVVISLYEQEFRENQ
jgi:hypothetical protein